MGRPSGRTLALGAAAALVTIPGIAGAAASPDARARRSASAAAGTGAGVASTATASQTMAVRGHELLVRTRADGKLRRITLAADLDPVAVAAKLRTRTDLFKSAGANLIARAADAPQPTAAASVDTGPLQTTPADTTPVPTSPASTTPVATPAPVPEASTPATALKGFIPNDHVGDQSWAALQWNFIGAYGVNASEAWQTLRNRGAQYAGGRGVRVAVVDSGVAYRTRGGYVASPDLPANRILQGYDFVDDDRFPDDRSGHGTHVASTIAAATNNDAGLTGLAYEADILPVRVLDESDEGDVISIARGIRYAVRHHAEMMNLSIDFPVSATAEDIPEVMDAIEYARSKGVLVIASSGNDGTGEVALPARSNSVLSVGATTVRGCRSTFSNSGAALDLMAPGGGTDHRGEMAVRCKPGAQGPPIAQVTLLRAGEPSQLGVPLDYVGTSMAAAHVTGIAALVYASGVLGKHPSANLLAAYLVRSTRDLGPKGRDDKYGAGLIDAQAAVNRTTSRAAVRGARRAVAHAASVKSKALPVGR
jgi:serine protease